MVVVVDLVSKFGFRFLFLGCISIVWHSQIQVMEFAFFFFLNFWVCVLGSGIVFLFKIHLDLNSYNF